MKIPPFLQPGSKIRIISPAGKVDEKYILPAVSWLKSKGYKVELGEHIFARHFQFAGTDEQRLQDLQIAFDDPETDAIICSRGGYGTVRIINQINFGAFIKKPTWLVGFSDISILHAGLNNLRVASIHGAMPRYFFDLNGIPNQNLESLMNLLLGKTTNYTFDHSKYNISGYAEAELVGGNLSIITSLQGTKYELNTRGKILFLEDIDEFLYHTDRMIHQLKLAGKLNKLAGLILGDFTDMKDNKSPFGKNVHEIISDAVKEFNYPVCFGMPAGHDKKNLALIFGGKCTLEVSENTILTFNIKP